MGAAAIARVGWSDERTDRLKALWSEGHSAAAIAAELGGMTRNAVLGSCGGLGWRDAAPWSR